MYCLLHTQSTVLVGILRLLEIMEATRPGKQFMPQSREPIYTYIVHIQLIYLRKLIFNATLTHLSIHTFMCDS
jgi:hypothetical protein